MRGDKARKGLGAEACLKYVEHPNRVQRSQRVALWFRSRKFVRNVGWVAAQTESGHWLMEPSGLRYFRLNTVLHPMP